MVLFESKLFFSAAYSDPNFYYEFTARYHSAPCNSIYNTNFEKKLLQILAKLVVELACEVSLQKSECHHVKMQRAGMQNELFFTFKGKTSLKSCSWMHVFHDKLKTIFVPYIKGVSDRSYVKVIEMLIDNVQ